MTKYPLSIFICAVLFILVFTSGCSKQYQDDQVVFSASKINTLCNNAFNYGEMTSDGTYIYFCEFLKGIYRANPDGTDIVKISDVICHGIFYYDGWIYYSGSSAKLRKVTVNGEHDQEMYDIISTHIVVYDDYIYALARSEEEEIKLHRFSLDGSDKQLMLDKRAHKFVIYNDFIYVDTDDGIYKVSFDAECEMFYENTHNITWFNFYNDELYYIKTSSKKTSSLIKVDHNGNEIIIYELGEELEQRSIVMSENIIHCSIVKWYIFFTTSEYTVIDVEANVIKKHKPYRGNNLFGQSNYMLNGRAYNIGNHTIYSLNMDGTNFKAFEMPDNW